MKTINIILFATCIFINTIQAKQTDSTLYKISVSYNGHFAVTDRLVNRFIIKNDPTITIYTLKNNDSTQSYAYAHGFTADFARKLKKTWYLHANYQFLNARITSLYGKKTEIVFDNVSSIGNIKDVVKSACNFHSINFNISYTKYYYKKIIVEPYLGIGINYTNKLQQEYTTKKIETSNLFGNQQDYVNFNKYNVTFKNVSILSLNAGLQVGIAHKKIEYKYGLNYKLLPFPMVNELGVIENKKIFSNFIYHSFNVCYNFNF